MFTITVEELDRVTTIPDCPRCENSGLRRDGCPNCGSTGKSLDSIVCEASSLGLKPGEWPERILINFAGKFSSYVRQNHVNEFGTRLYKSPGRSDLVVLND